MSEQRGFHDDLQVHVEPLDPDTVPGMPSRRFRRATLVVSVLAVVAAAAWFVGKDRQKLDAQPPAIASPSVNLDRYVDYALRQVGHDSRWASQLDSVWAAPVSTAPAVHTFGGVDDPWPAGEYRVLASCAGEGSVRFVWSSPRGSLPFSSGDLTLQCATEGIAGAGLITLNQPGEIQFAVSDRNGRAGGRSAFAVSMTDPLAMTAQTRLGPPGPTTVLRHSALASGSLSMSGDADAGRYRLTAIGVGQGALLIELRLGNDLATREELACSAAGTPLELSLQSLGSGLLVVSMTDELGGRPRCGYAVQVDRLS